MMPSERKKLSIRRHPLMETITGLRGNERACIYTEPLWAIPVALYTPFFSVYLHAMGISDRRIGVLLSIGMFCQVFAVLFGGILTDKLGRRLTTFVVDLFAWSLPVLLWMLAQNYWWFVVAAIFNSLWQITMVSWNCLMVEDCDQGKLVHIYTWCTISGLLSVFFAPLASLLVTHYPMVVAFRILMAVTLAMMTAKFTILFFLSRETRQGRIRMQETRGIPVTRMLGEYRHLIGRILRTPGTLQILAIMVLINITSTVTGSFFALYATQSLNLAESNLALFPIGRAAVMLLFIFMVQARLNRRSYKIPMLTGLVLYIASQLILIGAPKGNLAYLLVYILLEAFAYALVIPMKDSLIVMLVEPAERARIFSLMIAFMIGISAPFGWIAGELSQNNRSWPFILNIVLFAGCFFLILRARPARPA
jgi:MFS family permease